MMMEDKEIRDVGLDWVCISGHRNAMGAGKRAAKAIDFWVKQEKLVKE